MDDDISQRDLPPRPPRFQFSLLTIFIVLTVCAAVAGLIRAIPLPPYGRYVAAIYLISLAVPLILRLPTIVRTLQTSSARMRQIREERERLVILARQRQRERHGESEGGDAAED